MRNLAIAALCVMVLEPEALLGASFQLSFAAVGALVAVYEARSAALAREAEQAVVIPARAGKVGWLGRRRHGPWTQGRIVRHLLRDQRDGLVHGLRFPRAEPVCPRRKPAHVGHHRDLRRARRAARHGTLSARPRRAGVALGRPRHRHRHARGALHRRAAGREPAPAGLRALVARRARAGRSLRHPLAQRDPARDRDPARPRRACSGAATGTGLRHRRGADRRGGGGAPGRRPPRRDRPPPPAASTPSNGCAPTPTRATPRPRSTRTSATRSAASPISPTAERWPSTSTAPPSPRIVLVRPWS